jgi:hypothetical protein
MTVGIGNETRTYVLGSGDPLALRLPADTSITISSKSVFVPDNYYHNGDMRRFTVAFNLQDVPSE